VLETLDKDVYSKRSELTGKDGNAIETKVVAFNLIVPNENNNADNQAAAEAIPSVEDTTGQPK
jgi:hypothetical protein